MTTQSSHGSKAALSVDGVDISRWTTQSELKEAADKSETSAYGSTGHEYADDEGLDADVFTCSGWYDKTATTGTSAVFRGKKGQNMPIVFGEFGSTAGFERNTFTAHLDEFVTTVPVNDIVKWSASFTVSGSVVTDVYA